MLRRLKVENYALIDRLELELDDRLNIITGETGAGKSILLGALGLLLGNKNDNATLKDDKRNCLIEGVFDLGTRDLQAFFDRNDLDYSRETTLTRQITPTPESDPGIRGFPHAGRRYGRRKPRPADAIYDPLRTALPPAP